MTLHYLTGAAAIVLTTVKEARERNLPIKAVIRGTADAAQVI